MKNKDILQFEEDDASEMGINGKQVFFTKRINGKTTHNKLPEDERNQKIINDDKSELKKEDDDELFIEFKTPYYSKEDIEKKKNSKKSNKNNQKKRISKKQKNAKKKKRIMKIFMLLLLIIGVIIFAMVSPLFNIEEIEVKGNEKINQSTIVSLSGVEEGKNIFQIKKSDIISKIKENAYIDSVTIKRILPGTLQLTVRERKVAYQVKVINSYVYLDYQGYILEVSPKDGNVPFIEGISTEQDTLLKEKRLSNNDISILNVLLKITEASKNAGFGEVVSKIKIENNTYILELNKENKVVYLGNATNLTNRMSFLKAILDKTKGESGKIFIDGDLNNGFKPYFREDIKKVEKSKK